MKKEWRREGQKFDLTVQWGDHLNWDMIFVNNTLNSGQAGVWTRASRSTDPCYPNCANRADFDANEIYTCSDSQLQGTYKS